MKLEPLAIALLLSVGALSAFANEQRCGAHELEASLRLTDPGYSDAMLLQQELNHHGFAVQCVLRSKWSGMFRDAKWGYQSTGALFRTNRGDFTVLFLPAPYVFDALKVNEQRSGDWYDYSFRGSPPSATHIGTRYPVDFIRRGNKMFIVHDNAILAVELATIPLR
jgi:hypothetical protein